MAEQNKVTDLVPHSQETETLKFQRGEEASVLPVGPGARPRWHQSGRWYVLVQWDRSYRCFIVDIPTCLSGLKCFLPGLPRDLSEDYRVYKVRCVKRYDRSALCEVIPTNAHGQELDDVELDDVELYDPDERS